MIFWFLETSKPFYSRTNTVRITKTITLSLTLWDSPFNIIMSWFKMSLILHARKHTQSFMNLLLSYKKNNQETNL